MHVINAHFESLHVLPVSALFGAIGVYVIWSARADARPSYMGEGKLIRRFVNEHVERFGTNMSGYVAILTDRTAKQLKSDAEIVEMIREASFRNPKLGWFFAPNRSWPVPTISSQGGRRASPSFGVKRRHSRRG